MYKRALLLCLIATLLSIACGQPPPADQQSPGETQLPKDTTAGPAVTPVKIDSPRGIPRGVPVPPEDYEKLKKDAQKKGPEEKGDTDEGH